MCCPLVPFVWPWCPGLQGISFLSSTLTWPVLRCFGGRVACPCPGTSFPFGRCVLSWFCLGELFHPQNFYLDRSICFVSCLFLSCCLVSVAIFWDLALDFLCSIRTSRKLAGLSFLSGFLSLFSWSSGSFLQTFLLGGWVACPAPPSFLSVQMAASFPCSAHTCKSSIGHLPLGWHSGRSIVSLIPFTILSPIHRIRAIVLS